MIGSRGALLARGFSTSSRLANLEEKKIGIIGMGNVGKGHFQNKEFYTWKAERRLNLKVVT